MPQTDSTKLGPPLTELPVQQLVERSQAGSLPAFAELLERFQQPLFNFLLRRCRCEADAEDLTQEAFVRAWQAIDKYDPRWQFSTWLYTIARRGAVNLHRQQQRNRAASLQNDTPDDTEPLLERLTRQEQGSRAWALVDIVLTTAQRTALWLRYAEGMAIRDIARILGSTPLGVRVTLHRGRRTLARHLERPETDPLPTAHASRLAGESL